MESSEFDDAFAHAGQIARALRSTFEEVTGDDLDLEAAVKHYPVLALALAGGAGFLGGWWMARRSRRGLPAPKQPSILDSALNTIREAGLRLTPSTDSAAVHDVPEEHSDGLLPSGMNVLRRTLPELLTEERVEEARLWIESVVEPRVQSEIDGAISSFSRGKIGAFLRNQARTWGLEIETTLDDSEDGSPSPTSE